MILWLLVARNRNELCIYMPRRLRQFRASIPLGFGGVLLSSLAALAGCSNHGEGTVTVSAESRARIVPHSGPNAKNKEGSPIDSKPLSAKLKVRGYAASGAP